MKLEKMENGELHRWNTTNLDGMLKLSICITYINSPVLLNNSPK